MRMRGSLDRSVLVLVVALALVLVLTWSAGGSPSREAQGTVPAHHTIAVYGFSVEEEVMTKEIFPAFQDYWLKKTGEEVAFQRVFTSTEQLTDEILDGAAVDVAILSNEQHATWLRISNYVDTDWHTFPEQGIISQSPLVIAVRPGNPLMIEDWADLARPGVRLIHPDPRTSGGAQWAVLAEYGSASLGKGSGGRDAAFAQLRDIWANVIIAPTSSQEALKQFVFGRGDALVTYEQSALLAQARGAALEVVTPRCTIMSEHVVVLVDRNVHLWERDVVEAFVDFMWSETAQEALTRYYFRSVVDEEFNQAVPEFYQIERPLTARDLGGWERAYPEIINAVWEEQILKGTD